MAVVLLVCLFANKQAFEFKPSCIKEASSRQMVLVHFMAGQPSLIMKYRLSCTKLCISFFTTKRQKKYQLFDKLEHD